MRFCSQCGAELEAGSKFCSGCGSAVVAASIPAATPAPTAPSVLVPPPAAAAASTASGRGSGRGFKYAFLGLVLVLVAAGSYLYATPYLALQKFRSAVERGAYSELSDAIDYEALKRSLSRVIQGGLAQIARDEEEAGNKGGGDLLGGLSGLLGMGVDRVLDKAVTPEALRQIESAVASGKPLFDTAKGQAGQPSQQEEFDKLLARLKAETEVSSGYTGLNSFELRAAHPQMGTAKLLFARQGLTDWRLVGIDAGNALPVLARRIGLASNEAEIAAAARKRKDFVAAKKWLGAAVEQGLPAHVVLAWLPLEEGKPERLDPAEFVRVIRMGADSGNSEAAFVLARLQESGLGVTRDFSAALKLYEKSYQLKPSVEAAFFIARMYHEGRDGITRDLAAAKTWLHNAKQVSRTGGFRSITFDGDMHHVVTIAELLEDLESAISSGNSSAYVPPWLAALRNAEFKPGAGVGPIRLGADALEVEAVLGKPRRIHIHDEQFQQWSYSFLAAGLELVFVYKRLAVIMIGNVHEADSSHLPVFSAQSSSGEVLARHFGSPWKEETPGRDMIVNISGCRFGNWTELPRQTWRFLPHVTAPRGDYRPVTVHSDQMSYGPSRVSAVTSNSAGARAAFAVAECKHSDKYKWIVLSKQ